MALYLIGLGLGDSKDITLRGLELVQKSDKVYLESYTSLLQCPVSELESAWNCKIEVAYRPRVEQGGDDIVEEAKSSDVSLLIIGDVFGATTHWDIMSRAKEAGVEVEVVHNASVLTAISATGLQLYKFGRVASIPFPAPNWKVETPYTILKDNMSIGLHSLFLLDLDPPNDKYMTANEAIAILLKLEEEKKEGLLTSDTKFIACARLGCKDAVIKYGTADELKDVDFGGAPHCVIVPGKMHFAEEEALEIFN